jgi:hypothetical protein
MTVSSAASRSSAPSRPGPASRAGPFAKGRGERLVEWALDRLCARLTGHHDGESALRLLVLVAPAGRCAAEIVVDFLRRRGGPQAAAALVSRGAVWHGRPLVTALARDLGGDHPGRFLRRLARLPLVVIDAVSGLGGPDEQQAFLYLLDACAASGTPVCISLADHPRHDSGRGLDAAVATRLCGGLVVALPAMSCPPAQGAAAGGAVTLPRVLRLVARHHDLDVATLIGPNRSRSIAAARSLAMYLARLVTGQSLQAIGTGCGGRDHTTVLHATRTVAARLAHDPAFAGDVARLVETLSVGRRPGPPRRIDTSVDSRPSGDRHDSDGAVKPHRALRRHHVSRRRTRGRRPA